jgi:hypothetical protein
MSGIYTSSAFIKAYNVFGAYPFTVLGEDYEVLRTFSGAKHKINIMPDLYYKHTV